MAIRHVTFVVLPVTDQDRALAFYVQQLGFEMATDSGYQQGARWIELEGNAVMLGERKAG